MNRLSQVRALKGLSRDRLAELAGVTGESIRKYELGRLPGIDKAYAIAVALEVTVEEIWPVTTQPEAAHSVGTSVQRSAD